MATSILALIHKCPCKCCTELQLFKEDTLAIHRNKEHLYGPQFESCLSGSLASRELFQICRWCSHAECAAAGGRWGWTFQSARHQHCTTNAQTYASLTLNSLLLETFCFAKTLNIFLCLLQLQINLLIYLKWLDCFCIPVLCRTTPAFPVFATNRQAYHSLTWWNSRTFHEQFVALLTILAITNLKHS